MSRAAFFFVFFLSIHCASPKVQEREITIEDDTDLFVLDENPEQNFFWVSERKGSILYKKPDSTAPAIQNLKFRTKVYPNDHSDTEISASWISVKVGNLMGYVKTSFLSKKFPEKFHGYKIGPEEELCDNISNSFECYKAIEYIQSARPEVSGKFKRLEDQAQIRLYGKKMLLKDSSPEKQYRFLKYFPSVRYFLIAVQYYEGSSLLLLNERNGKTFTIPDFPAISPDNKRIVSASSCHPALQGYCKNEILIFQFIKQSNDLKKEFYLNPEEYGIGDPFWTSNSEISLGYYPFSTKESQSPEKSVILRLVKGRWYLKKPKVSK